MGSAHRSQRKRKRHQSSSSFQKTQIGRRLEKLRLRPRNLWADSEDETSRSHKKPCIALTEEEERPSSSLSRKRTSRSQNEKSATCLICSIRSQLSSTNCCFEHLSALNNRQQQTTNPQSLSGQVMIIPLTDEIAQQYLNSKQIHHLKTRASTQQKTPVRRRPSTRKLIMKSTESLHTSDVQQPPESSQTDLPPLASTIVVESARSRSATIPPDVTITTFESTSTTVVSQKGDDQQEKTASNKQPIDPWTPISDEIEAALEDTLNQIDSSVDSPLEFTPSTVRRTETGVMAARLPKLSLKPGRFRLGKPINDRASNDVANEYRPQGVHRTSTTATSPPTASSSACQTSPRTADTSDDLIDMASSSIFTQDVSSHHPTTTTAANEDGTLDTGTNGPNGTTRLTSSATNGKMTPSRFSYVLNPDGTRVSLSRPALPTNSHSPLVNTLRRTSTDVTPS